MILRFVTGNDWISNAIRVGEHDGWPTHTEALMPEGGYLGAHLSGGVMIRPIGYDDGSRTRELLITIDASKDQNDKFHAFLKAQIGKPYDKAAIAGLALNRNWRTPDSWFCSELMAAALEECGYLFKLSVTDNHISPRDLLLVLSGRIAIPDAT